MHAYICNYVCVCVIMCASRHTDELKSWHDIYMHRQEYVHVSAHAQIRTYMHTYKHLHTYIYIYIHTYTHTLSCIQLCILA